MGLGQYILSLIYPCPSIFCIQFNYYAMIIALVTALVAVFTSFAYPDLNGREIKIPVQKITRQPKDILLNIGAFSILMIVVIIVVIFR